MFDSPIFGFEAAEAASSESANTLQSRSGNMRDWRVKSAGSICLTIELRFAMPRLVDLDEGFFGDHLNSRVFGRTAALLKQSLPVFASSASDEGRRGVYELL